MSGEVDIKLSRDALAMACAAADRCGPGREGEFWLLLAAELSACVDEVAVEVAAPAAIEAARASVMRRRLQ